VDQSLAELDLPKGVVVGGISRAETTFVPDGSTRVRLGDRVILFATADDIEETADLFSA
jgi:Trk K+ transport system NAD-binding subunit